MTLQLIGIAASSSSTFSKDWTCHLTIPTKQKKNLGVTILEIRLLHMERSRGVAVDPKSGFCSETKTFHSLRPPLSLPPHRIPLSVAAYVFSLRSTSPWSDSAALLDSATAHRLSYSDLSHQTKTLAASLRIKMGLSRGDAALILSPNSTRVPILYLSLLSIGVAVSPANPTSTESEISRQIQISKPVIAFATSSTRHKVPSLRYGTLLIDSAEFGSMLTSSCGEPGGVDEVSQSDVAAIMYSSGTTGLAKGVMLTHRNLIAMVASYCSLQPERSSPAIWLYTVPYFHIFGLFYGLKSVALSETVVVMERFDLSKMLRAVETFRVTHVALAPPVVVAMGKGDVTDRYDLRSLEAVACGGAPLRKEAIAAFMAKFPTVLLQQGYGMTETAGGIYRSVGADECLRLGSVGRLSANCEAKIVDPDTSIALPPRKQGELWVRGPTTMKGYVDEPATLESDGWLRTGDLCYIDEEGYLFVVDRLKDLIKYKGYQVCPAELEQLLQSHQEIVEAVVVPFPVEETGEVPMAFVVKHPQSSLDESQVMDFIAKQVAPHKKIRRVAFVSSIPRNAGGKILRGELKKIAIPVPLSKL